MTNGNSKLAQGSAFQAATAALTLADRAAGYKAAQKKGTSGTGANGRRERKTIPSVKPVANEQKPCSLWDWYVQGQKWEWEFIVSILGAAASGLSMAANSLRGGLKKANEAAVSGINAIKDLLKSIWDKAKNIYNLTEDYIRDIGKVLTGDGIGTGYIKLLNPNEIRFSQSSVNGSAQITESMRMNGWVGKPIDVVIMPDGKYTTMDNTRVVAARNAGIDVLANVHTYDELLPQEYIERFTTRQGVPSTWGEAIEFRIGKQNRDFRINNPYGSWSMDIPKQRSD